MEKKENVFEISSYALRTMEMEKKKVDEKQNRFFSSQSNTVARTFIFLVQS